MINVVTLSLGEIDASND